MRNHSLLCLAFAMLVGCTTSGGDDGGDDGSTPPTYSNHVMLKCDDQVLIDRTFTSKSECESFASSHEYTCHTIKLPISC